MKKKERKQKDEEVQMVVLAVVLLWTVEDRIFWKISKSFGSDLKRR